MVTIPTLPAPVIPQEPPKPILELPNVIVLTQVETEYYQEACDAYHSIGQEDGFDSEDEWQQEYPGLTQGSACDWAIYGFVVQDWLTLESQLADIARYVDELRAQNEFLKDMLLTRYKIIAEQRKKME